MSKQYVAIEVGGDDGTERKMLLLHPATVDILTRDNAGPKLLEALAIIAVVKMYPDKGSLKTVTTPQVQPDAENIFLPIFQSEDYTRDDARADWETGNFVGVMIIALEPNQVTSIIP